MFQTRIGEIPTLSGSIENRAGHDHGPRKKFPYLLREPRNVGGPEVPVNAKQKWTKKMLFHKRSREYTGLCHAALVFSAREKVPCMVRTQLNVWGARRMCGHSSKNDTENTIFPSLLYYWMRGYGLYGDEDKGYLPLRDKRVHARYNRSIKSRTMRFTWTTSSSIARYPEILTGYRPPLKHDIYLGLEPISTTLVRRSKARRQGP